MSKNVNNDVSKDSPIVETLFKILGSFKYHCISLYYLLNKIRPTTQHRPYK